MLQHRRTYLVPSWRLFARTWVGTVIFVLAVFAFVCGLTGFAWEYAFAKVDPTAVADGTASAPADWSIPIFKTVQLFLLNAGAEDDLRAPSWLLFVARLAAALLFLVVSSTFILRVVDEARRLPRQLTQSDHVVICGLGRVGLQLLDDLHQAGKARRVVIVESDPTNRWLEYARTLGAAIVVGDCTKSESLIRARAAYAREAFVVTGDDGENLEVAAELDVILSRTKARAERLRLYVHVADMHLASTLRPYCPSLHSTDQIEIHVFNVLKSAATQVITEQVWRFAAQLPDEVAHLAIVGFGPMGQAIAVQLAHLAHFPNRKRNRVTIAADRVGLKARSFLSRYARFTSWTESAMGVTAFPAMADEWAWNQHPLPADVAIEEPDAVQYVCNAEFIDLPQGLVHESFAAGLLRRFESSKVKPMVFVCEQSDQENFDQAARLREFFLNAGRPDIPIFVWLKEQSALAAALGRRANESFGDPSSMIIPFGDSANAAGYREITQPMREPLAEVAHGAWRDAEIQNGRPAPPPWEASEDFQRESSLAAADHMLLKLRTVGVTLVRKSDATQRGGRFVREFSAATRRALAEMEHYRWTAERLMSGWRYCRKSLSDAKNNQKMRKLNHNLTTFEKADAEKDFEQITAVVAACQQLEHFILVRKDETTGVDSP